MKPPETPPSFKRTWMRFPAPDKQLVLFLPTFLIVAALAVAAGLSMHRVKMRALEALATQGVASDASREFLKQTGGFNLAIYGVTAAVGVVAVVWLWWLSVWIFGPTRRLERDLNDVLYGKMSPENIRVRKGDALYSLVERVRETLLQKKPPEKK